MGKRAPKFCMILFLKIGIQEAIAYMVCVPTILLF